MIKIPKFATQLLEWLAKLHLHTVHIIIYIYTYDLKKNFFELFFPDEEAKHPAGYHIYPFSVALPASIPSSFEGRRGYIRYQCMAFLDRGWKGVLDCDMDFTVIRHLDLNTMQNVAVSKTFKKIFLSLPTCASCCLSVAGVRFCQISCFVSKSHSCLACGVDKRIQGFIQVYT